MFLYRCYLRLLSWFKKKSRDYDLIILKKNIHVSGGKVGTNFMVGNNVMISGLENIDIGDDVSIGTGSFIRANGGLKIGSNVVISRNLVLYTTSHNYEGDRLPFDSTDIYNQVIIEDNVWIGMNVTISPGSIIREGAIIGLGSAVWGEVGKGQIIGSDRPKVIKYRDEGHYEKLRKKSG